MRMLHDLPEIIGRIFDASTRSHLWPAALGAVSAHVGADMVMIVSADHLDPKRPKLLGAWKDLPSHTRLFLSKYGQTGVASPGGTDLTPGIAVSLLDQYLTAPPQDSGLRQEWMEPQGLVDLILVNLAGTRAGPALLLLGRNRSTGPADRAALRRTQTLVPHIQRAIGLGAFLSTTKDDLETLRDLALGRGASVFLVDGDLGITRSLSANRWLSNASEIVWLGPDGTHRMDRRLSDEIGRFCAAPRTDGADRRHTLSLSGRNGKDWLVQLLCLRKDDRPNANSDGNVVAVHIRPAELDTISGLAILARHFQLTPREAEVLGSLVTHGGLPNVALKHGISARTAKSHLHSVFAKTGTARQADLVKLLARFSPQG